MPRRERSERFWQREAAGVKALMGKPPRGYVRRISNGREEYVHAVTNAIYNKEEHAADMKAARERRAAEKKKEARAAKRERRFDRHARASPSATALCRFLVHAIPLSPTLPPVFACLT